MKKHILKIKPVKSTGSAVKTKETGLACVPSGDPPDFL